MLWVKAFHIVFVIAWFAGLLYLPRLFVYHAMSHDETSRARFVVMEQKLFVIMSVGGAGALVFGLWLLHRYTWMAHPHATWLYLKLGLVTLLIAYHLYCARLMQALRAGECRHGHRFFRLINEVPAGMMVVIVLLAVVKRPA